LLHFLANITEKASNDTISTLEENVTETSESDLSEHETIEETMIPFNDANNGNIEINNEDHCESNLWLSPQSNTKNKSPIKAKYNTLETKELGRIFRLYNVHKTAGNAILKLLSKPEFNLDNVAPTWYYLEQVEKHHLKKKVTKENY
jgi:hypothetical protein